MNESELITDCFSSLPPSVQGGIIAIGNFDGVHRGHRRLLAKLRSQARKAHVPAIVVSFEPHPIAVLRPGRAPVPLTWPARKVALLAAAGADGVVLYRSNEALLDLTADAFFREIIVGRLHARGLVEGPDFGFGKGRTGDVARLRTMCDAAGLSLDIVPLVHGDGAPVSSTRIRSLLANGDVSEARDLLGRPHGVAGTVVVGDQRGRTLGFPTANLDPVVGFLPAEGVYAAETCIAGVRYAAAVNLGPNPTFQIQTRKVEVHVIGFSGDLYGQTLEVELLKNLRETRPFAGLDALKLQLSRDIAAATEVWRVEKKRPPEIVLTIEEWLRAEIEPAFLPLGGRLLTVSLQDGVLNLNWQLPTAKLPTDRFELALNLEKRIREIFPEVQYVESESLGRGSE